MIAIVCGGRDFDDPVFMAEKLDEIAPTFIIEGGQASWVNDERRYIGADYYAERWAERRGVPFACVKAHWASLPKKAGPIRNGWMLRLKPDVVIAFPGGNGTADMVRQARAAEVKVIEVRP